MVFHKDTGFFTDKIVLITGGASGIGQALATELGRRGAIVKVGDLNGEAADTVSRLVREQGGRSDSLQLDVTNLRLFQDRVDEIVDQHGRLDLLFNNAGIGVTGETKDLPPSAWDRIIDVNLKGVVHGIEAAYPHMLRRGAGHIANTACVAGLVPLPMTSAYTATKHAVVGLSASMRAEAAPEGVKVSVICPGVVDTAMFDSIEYFGVDKQALLAPVGRAMMTPEACARTILRGVQKNHAVITVGAYSRLMWWLYRMAPRVFLKAAGTGFRIFRGRLSK